VSAIRRVAAGGRELVDEIVTLGTRGEVRQSFLLATTGGHRSSVVALMFPGGPGVVGLPADVNQLERGTKFLVRTRDLFRDDEVAVAIVDAPSDREGGMYDDFRSGHEHLQDVRAVVAELKRRFPGARVFLVGTSRGTVSAAHLARALGAEIDGVVLASTVLSGGRSNPGLRDFDFGTIPAPILFVHHARDGCPVCPYAPVSQLSRRYPLVTVKGGRAAESDECEPLSPHGYLGKEAETVLAIKSWMLGRPYPEVVE
jgi:alpha/beta superfamily hydrolase